MIQSVLFFLSYALAPLQYRKTQIVPAWAFLAYALCLPMFLADSSQAAAGGSADPSVEVSYLYIFDANGDVEFSRVKKFSANGAAWREVRERQISPCPLHCTVLYTDNAKVFQLRLAVEWLDASGALQRIYAPEQMRVFASTRQLRAEGAIREKTPIL